MCNELKRVIKNAIITATRVYGYTRKYEGCCPDWSGKIIGEVVTFWKNGILNAKYVSR